MTRQAGLVLALAAAAALVGPPTPMAAQDTWVSAWGGIFMDPGSVEDADSNTEWDFGTGFVGGLDVQRRFGQSLMAGLEVGYSPIEHEVRDADSNEVLDSGTARILTTMIVGRLGAGRGSGFVTYLAGGVGALTYGIPHTDAWDSDFALRGGGGIEYGARPDLALFLQWNRYWAFHQAEGVQDNTINHSLLQIGLRYGL